jgi:hypothetical protein
VTALLCFDASLPPSFASVMSFQKISFAGWMFGGDTTALPRPCRFLAVVSRGREGQLTCRRDRLGRHCGMVASPVVTAGGDVPAVLVSGGF